MRSNVAKWSGAVELNYILLAGCQLCCRYTNSACAGTGLFVYK